MLRSDKVVTHPRRLFLRKEDDAPRTLGESLPHSPS
jgi:hypothetical protein